ncbi:MAG: hypothetical protein GC192_01985 [Bacteroidetes bacterium]|nr:hypothetical protein [Bacteroidota bacterium]
MKKSIAAFIFFVFCVQGISAQYIISGQDTLLGNEWINFNQTYFKIKVAEDGIYRIGYQTLENAGVPISQINGAQFQLWHNGEEAPISTSTEGTFGTNDYIEFFGKKNTSELDKYLYKFPDSMMMNPLYSLITDTAAYFLTYVNGGGNSRFQLVSNDLNNLPAKEEYYMARLVNNNFSNISKFATSDGISTSDYSLSEGFASSLNTTKTYTLAPTAIFQGGDSPSISLRFSGNSVQHQQIVTLNDQTIYTAEYYGFELQRPSIDLTVNQLTNSMSIKIQGLLTNADKHRLSNIILTYPRQFDFENKKIYAFDIKASSSKKYLEISNFNVSSGQPVLFDLTNKLQIAGIDEGGVTKIALPPSNLDRSLILVNDVGGIVEVTNIEPISFVNYETLNHDFIIVTGEGLLNDGNGNDRVLEYAEYRTSISGGAYDPIIVTAEELYDQFSWGIERHPFSIRNFALYIKKHWSSAKYFLIIGKGREYPALRTSSGLQSALDFGFYVPTYSLPGSDNMLIVGDDGFTPVLSLGRIAATNPNELKTYLDKIKEFESNINLPQTIEEKSWMKKVLHMGGGLTASEQNAVHAGLANMETILMNSQYGASVKSFFKTSSDPIQVSQTEQIFDYINKGTSFITFFGHSAVGTFDFSIDNPDNFENKGKYPMLVSLGCYSGNIHTGSQGLSERFCFFKDKGAIAFGGTSGEGYISSLSNFASNLYQNIGNEDYGRGIGDAIKSTISNFQGNDFGINLIRQQFNFHGDPSLRINTFEGPDFLVDGSTVKLTPENITTQLENFEVKFDIINIGKAVNDSMLVKIKRELPDGTQIDVTELNVETPSYKGSYTVTVPTLGKLAQGFNKILVIIDDGNKIDERPNPFAEQNNELVIGGTKGLNFYISDNSVVCVYPTNFAIVGNSDIELIASTSEPLLPERSYVFQLDTTELFNSPKLQTHKILQTGGVLKWKPSPNFNNEEVYYWRVSPDSISQVDNFIWDNSSFVYLDGVSGGWNQSHFYQWKKDAFEDMELKSHENLKFIDDFKDVFIRNAVNSVNNMELQINNAFSGRMYPTPPGMYVTVFDSTSAKQWINIQPSQYGLLNPSNHNVAMYLFSTQDLAGRSQLIDFLQQVVPSKNYVLVFTNQISLTSDYKPEEWESDSSALGTDLFQVLESQGANLIRNTITSGALPYVFAYRKDVGPIVEELADSLKQVLRVNFGIPGYWDSGNITSTPIGPATKWSKLIWDNKLLPNSQSDTFSVDLLGYDPTTLTDTMLISKLEPGDHDITTISAIDYPYIKLRFNSKDSLNRTSAEMSHWRIFYQGVPDFAVNPSTAFVFDSDTLQQGKQFNLRCLVENLSDFTGDSLLVKFSLRNSSNHEEVFFKREANMLAHDTLYTGIQIETQNLNGNYGLTLELNPNDEQQEITRVNNILSKNFAISNDLRNPLLDVTFDGLHIIDGDLVSSKPDIKISLKDENPYLLLNDTSLFRIFFIYPDSESVLRRVYFNNPNLDFSPANTSSDNKAFIELRPNFLQDGIYKLIIQSQDVAGNQAGSNDYKIAFKVITKSSISNFLNYPNPFTTSTRFVYTMTGAEPPANYKVQIMTNSGRIVREITQAELGPLKVGTNKTDFAWDGTDQFGDKLAKGIYLYRILIQDVNGTDWETYTTDADKYFAKGFGKMVLLR